MKFLPTWQWCAILYLRNRNQNNDLITERLIRWKRMLVFQTDKPTEEALHQF